MEPDERAALATYLTGLGDDELILGHRASEWCGHAPILEEDIAFANIALDEIGHAQIWYGLVADLLGEDREAYPDWMAFRRPPREFRSTWLVALPRGDWAFTIVRQYLFDAAEARRLAELRASRYAPLAGAAAKIAKEEFYHLRHTASWVRRLGLGTDESRARAQRALDELWAYALGLFVPGPGEAGLARAGSVPQAGVLRRAWEAQVVPHLEGAGLRAPEGAEPVVGSRAEGSDHLVELLAEMQALARQYPEARW